MNIDLKEIEARNAERKRLRDAASELPWLWEKSQDSEYEMAALRATLTVGAVLIANSEAVSPCESREFIDGYPKDFAWIQHAVNDTAVEDVAALLDEIKSLEAVLRKLDPECSFQRSGA